MTLWFENSLKMQENKANNSVKKAKRKYVSENLDANKSDPRKTWRLINELQSRQSRSTSVSSQNRKPSFYLTWWYRWSI